MEQVGLGTYAIRRLFKELEAAGHMRLVPIIGDGTTFRGKRWHVFSVPSHSRECSYCTVGKPDAVSERKILEKDREQKNKRPQVCGPVSNFQSQIPTPDEVNAECKAQGIPAAVGVRFYALNDHYGWQIGGRPIKHWKTAFAGFVAADLDGKGEQMRDKTTNDEFWAWVRETFDEEEDREHVNAWVKAAARNKFMKRHKITGEKEPIGDYRKACLAFVETCRDMNIQR
jgi:hypothetical protein